MEKYICTSCGYQGRPTKIGKVRIIKELFIWLLFRIVNVFCFLLKSCPRYNCCPKCKKSEMLSIFYIRFPEYYSLYARIYTLASLSLQKTSIKDRETQRLILTQLINCFKFIGNPVNLVLHEIDSFDELTGQLIILSKNEDFEIASLAIEALNRISICSNSQKERTIGRIADYISRQTGEKNEARIIEALGTKRLVEWCNDGMIKSALYERTQTNPDLYIALNTSPRFFKVVELKQIFQSLVLVNRAGFVGLIRHFDYNLPYDLKDFVSFLMICSLYYDLSDIDVMRKWLKTIEKLGIPKTHINDLRDSLKGIYHTRGKLYKKEIEDFVQRNKNIIGVDSKEFLKKSKQY